MHVKPICVETVMGQNLLIWPIAVAACSKTALHILNSIKITECYLYPQVPTVYSNTKLNTAFAPVLKLSSAHDHNENKVRLRVLCNLRILIESTYKSLISHLIHI